MLRECRVAQEEKRMAVAKLAEVQRDHDLMRERTESKRDGQDAVERELRKLQEKHRETVALVHGLQTSRDHLEASVRIAQDEAQRITREREEERASWRKERADLQAQLSEAPRSGKIDEKYREKAATYKKKLRIALSNVQTLAQRIA